MGLYFGEGRILENKYMRKYGLTRYEANEMVSDFIDILNDIKNKMKLKKKTKKQIDAAVQKKFEEEFQKLCAM